MRTCLLTLLLGIAFGSSAFAQLNCAQEADRLVITSGTDQPVVQYVFSDPKILRPYFTGAYSPAGQLLTRRHPPVPQADATDHATMHPGIWLAMGDISGSDFWRNKAAIKHERFTAQPTIDNERLTFATECQLVTAEAKVIGRLNNQYTIQQLPGAARPVGHAVKLNATVIVWNATFTAEVEPLVFGDQEEMGFGVRLATPLIEKNGGTITNSENLVSAAKTWGQEALWCDYSGQIEGQSCGITLVASPSNFRESRWHNRDYGLMVANPFAIAAMKQGKPSQVVVKPNEPLTIAFAALLHSGQYEPREAVANLKAW